MYFDCGSDRINTSDGSYTLDGWNTIDTTNYSLSCTPEGGSTYTASGSTHSSSSWEQKPMLVGIDRSINIRSLKIYEGSELVKDYRPAKDDNGVVCLYEEVSQQYEYPSIGDFIDGEEFVPALMFKATQANSSVTISGGSASLKCSTDGSTWSNYTLGTTMTMNSVGDYVMFRGANGYGSGSRSLNGTTVSGTGKMTCTGSLLYLLNSDGLPPRESSIYGSCFYGMFKNNTSITTCPELPVSTLPNECCREMFQGCSSMGGTVKWNNIVSAN